MARFIEGVDRSQATLFPELLDDFVGDDNPVRVIDAFVEQLDLYGLGFDRAEPEATERPGYHPSVLLKLYIYGYLNRVQSSRRLEREAGRNVEVMWLTGRLVPDHKTIADFRKDNGKAIRRVCSRFVQLCHQLGLLARGAADRLDNLLRRLLRLIGFLSHLHSLVVTMSQKSSLVQTPKSVSQALTPDTEHAALAGTVPSTYLQ
jgi:transposase